MFLKGRKGCVWMQGNEQLLEVSGLETAFRIKDDYYNAVDDVSFELKKNEILAIVGESGCGKSTLATTIMGLHDPNHTKMTAQQKQARAIELLDQVGIPNPERVGKQYPHELSGGMRQRVIIAIAIACKPPILIADEPTTALDVTIQAQILDLLKDLQEETGSGIILITHDLGVVAEMADRVAVMYAGQFVEVATAEELFSHPKHPYTRSLLQSIPQENSDEEELHVIEGIVPSLTKLPRKGCRFAPRIPWIDASEHEENPTLHEVAPNHFVRCTCYKHFHFRDGEGEA
ncbi:ABC transporter ATP-binding protein [Enterococcus faecalis]|nr:ABC transporter ATP-binding protein [Enterococcus faecalis]